MLLMKIPKQKFDGLIVGAETITPWLKNKPELAKFYRAVRNYFLTVSETQIATDRLFRTEGAARQNKRPAVPVFTADLDRRI